MGTSEIIHVWKNPDYLASLGDSALDMLPNPAGLISTPYQEKKACAGFIFTLTPAFCTTPTCTDGAACPPPTGT